MRALFAAYCLVTGRGQAMIGVYKRALRVAVALADRGHDAAMLAGGRAHFADEATRRAEGALRFFDLERDEGKAPARVRAAIQRALDEVAPDLVVIGEAPLGGPLLEVTLGAVERGVPVAFLDNAYRPELAGEFTRVHGPMADGLVLTGPSSFHAAALPAHVCQVPPYAEADLGAARALLGSLDLRGERLVTVLAYDASVMQLGARLFAELATQGAECVLVAPAVDRCLEHLAVLAPSARSLARVIAPPLDPVLFGLVAASRLAIGKCAFMQIAEAIALRTPFVGVRFDRYFDPAELPAACARFVHATSSPDADRAAVAAARRLLATDPAEMARLHDGRTGAAARAAAFLESVARRPPRDATAECRSLGFKEALVAAALGAGDVAALRCTRIRSEPGREVFSLACRRDGVFTRLWASRFADGALRIEEDRGYEHLPPLALEEPMDDGETHR